MSNTPRFRVWDKKYSKMYYEGICVYEDGSFDLDRTSETNDKIEVVSSDSGQLVLMLSVGLTDKNCKRIYEGDVADGNWPYARRGIVTWDNARCGFFIAPFDADGKPGGRAAYDKGYKMNAAKVSIIGNIYQNQELLQQ